MKSQTNDSFPCYPDLCQKFKKHLHTTESRANQIIKNKYKTDEEFMNKKAINEIIFNFKSHYSSLYKELLLIEETVEIVKRFYIKENTYFRLPKLLSYYANNTQVFPMMSHIWESKYLQENIRSKQMLIDNDDFPEELEGLDLINFNYKRYANKSEDILFFTDDVNKSINREGHPTCESNSSDSGDKEEEGKNFPEQINSDISIEQLILKINIYEKEKKDSKEAFPLYERESKQKKSSKIKTTINSNLNILNEGKILSDTKVFKDSHDTTQKVNYLDEDVDKDIYNKLISSPRKERKLVTLKNKMPLRTESNNNLKIVLKTDNSSGEIDKKSTLKCERERGDSFFKIKKDLIELKENKNFKFKKTEEFIQNEIKRKEIENKRSKVIRNAIVKLKESQYINNLSNKTDRQTKTRNKLNLISTPSINKFKIYKTYDISNFQNSNPELNKKNGISSHLRLNTDRPIKEYSATSLQSSPNTPTPPQNKKGSTNIFNFTSNFAENFNSNFSSYKHSKFKAIQTNNPKSRNVQTSSNNNTPIFKSQTSRGDLFLSGTKLQFFDKKLKFKKITTDKSSQGSQTNLNSNLHSNKTLPTIKNNNNNKILTPSSAKGIISNNNKIKISKESLKNFKLKKVVKFNIN